MTLTRRKFLGQAVLTAAAATALGCEGGSTAPALPDYTYEGDLGPDDLFTYGVASGDPLPDGVILWTHLSPETTEGPVDVFYELATDPDFADRVAADWAVASPDADMTVKVDPRGLSPGTTYYYRFFALGRTSPIGRTRTAPDGPVDRLRVAVCSCARYDHGWFHAYRHLATRADIDVVLHLGDYIYEYGTEEVRAPEPLHETLTLEDYRLRYACYRRDPDLQEVHRQHAFIAVWDDHEVANDAWTDGASNHNEGEGDWAARRAAGVQAFHEWMPIRTQEPVDKIWRHVTYGALLDLYMLDTRLWGRDAPGSDGADIEAPDRQMMGVDQELWLFEALRASTARWRCIGQQIPVSLMMAGVAEFNADKWPEFPAARKRLLDTLAEPDLDNVVVLTGDVHSSWGYDLVLAPYEEGAYDPATGAGSVAVEIIAPSITSGGAPDPATARRLGDNFIGEEPHVVYANPGCHGYVVLDLTAERAHADWFFIDDVRDADAGEEYHGGAVTCGHGARRLIRVDAPADPPPGAPPLAPRDTDQDA